MSIGIVPTHFDNASIGVTNPMCLLLTVTSLCNTDNFIKPSSDKFPIRLEFRKGQMTTHCRHYPMDQISCRSGFSCPDKIICNIKMNGSRFYEDWSWDCNTSGGAVYYETCIGNKDKSCINVGSFHYRFKTVRGPVSIIHDKPRKHFNEDIERSYTENLLVFLVEAIIIAAMVVFMLGVVCCVGEGFCASICGLAAVGAVCAMSSTSGDSDWFDTNNCCDD